MKLPPAVLEKLKKPMGKMHVSFEQLIKMNKTHKIIAVGDICVLSLLALGIRPHLAVFDYKYMRKELPEMMINVLEREFRDMIIISNKAGTISDILIKKSKELIEKGGAVRIKGEEDLTALPFIRDAPAHMIIVYGQPHEGMVIVKPDKKIKKFTNEILNKK